jgi:hypothetical protein
MFIFLNNYENAKKIYSVRDSVKPTLMQFIEVLVVFFGQQKCQQLFLSALHFAAANALRKLVIHPKIRNMNILQTSSNTSYCF